MNNPSISTSARCVNTGTSAGGCGRRATVGSPNTIGCTLPKIAANDTPSESSSTGAAQGCTAMVVVRMRNSLANTPKGGMPRMATVPSINPHPTVGLTSAYPQMLSMSWVPVCCTACPAVQKMALLVSECTVM